MNFKKYIKKIVKSVLLFVEFFALFICFYLVFVLWGLFFSTGSIDENGEIEIFVRSNGVHTDICVPVKQGTTDWSQFFNPMDFKGDLPMEYVAMGWGDKGFFLDTPTWGELKTSTAVKAVFLPSNTAIHAEFIQTPTCSEVCVKTKVSKEAYLKMVKFIQNSFSLKQGRARLIANHGYGMNDNFYEANGSYHLFHTCNIWTNDVLKVGNVPTALYSLHPKGNIYYLRGEK